MLHSLLYNLFYSLLWTLALCRRPAPYELDQARIQPHRRKYAARPVNSVADVIVSDPLYRDASLRASMYYCPRLLCIESPSC